MKKTIIRIFGENNTLINGAFAMFIIALVALGCTCNKEFSFTNGKGDGDNRTVSNTDVAKNNDKDDEAPSDAEVQTLVQETTSSFADAVEKEDFSDFLSETSKDFQAQFNEPQLKKVFATFIDKKEAAVPLLKKASNSKVEFSSKPSIRVENNINVLDTSGTFKTQPYPVNFDLSYEREGAQWKLLKIKYKM